MAFSHLIKHIYNSGADDVIRRGKKISSLGFVQLVEHDEFAGNIVFRVKDDVYNSFYKVHIHKYEDAKQMQMRCTCTYKQGDICRHEIAAIFKFQDSLEKNLFLSLNVQYKQAHTVAKMKNIDLKILRLHTSPTIFEHAESMLKTAKLSITKAENERVEAELIYDSEKYSLVIQKNDERNFDTSCRCNESLHPLCEHKVFLFLYLLKNNRANYFESIRNWDKEKNKLLQIYGYSLSDDLKGKFEFIYKEGKPYLKLLDQSIKRVALPLAKESNNYTRQVIRPFITTVPKQEKTDVELDDSLETLGLVFNFTSKSFPFFSLDALKGAANDNHKVFIDKAVKLDLTKFVETDSFSENDKMFFQQIRKLQEVEVNKYLNRNSPFSSIWENIVQQEDSNLPEETKLLIADYYLPKLQRIFDEQHLNNQIFCLPEKKSFKASSLRQVELSKNSITPIFNVNVKDNGFQISCSVKLPGANVLINENESSSPLVFLYEDVMYLWQKAEDILRIEQFLQNGNIEIAKEDWSSYAEKELAELNKEYKIEYDKTLVKEIKNIVPDVKLLLQEKGDYLVFQPIFTYKSFDVKPSENDRITIPDNGQILIIQRNTEVEKSFEQKIKGLHSAFFNQSGSTNFILKGVDVLKNNWFFLFVDAMKEMKIPVFGFEALRNFRFNTARPTTHIHLSSGVDWFDAKVEIEFDKQRVDISDIKKALASKQSFVQLGDGTLGILPDEWLKKYSLLFRVGDGKNGKLRLSKYHLSIIDELYENRNEEELSFELDQKFERLREFKNINQIEAPKQLASILRPYQLSGFQWLNYLCDVGWGGILADDMGLGKTVQALTMFENYKTVNGNLLSLVVCPTTLIYNWQNEIKKFTPSLTHIIHHGSTRSKTIEELTPHNIIITTYGTLRSDVKLFLKINFDYAVLDESQAIKNPSSKVTKAATLLNVKNKLCMSGTPLQNNTFDIFAQMNFLNPGLLGSMEFFRNEFATPIDKFGEQEQKIHLRKLLTPFILRRTKEQVAKDLPEKTETILFCEMEKEQRKIYEAYRNTYRSKILGTIDEKGIQKSQLTILQGLIKLRQICDSPAILNEDEKFPNYSIKLDELTREIIENIGEHKALVFSQFLGMLGLIKEKLKELNVKFEYFDGSTSSLDREKAIQSFQNNEECRVFLISLKAGGVGLNLTAADYVYIVDPWWNPAVEQQAIDRTHRIGQTKNIFAYRMICVNSIEDKILQLQERKRILAKELIADESGFVKTLSKEDVEYLFS